MRAPYTNWGNLLTMLFRQWYQHIIYICMSISMEVSWVRICYHELDSCSTSISSTIEHKNRGLQGQFPRKNRCTICQLHNPQISRMSHPRTKHLLTLSEKRSILTKKGTPKDVRVESSEHVNILNFQFLQKSPICLKAP